jgi:hypothetical protein
LLIHLYVLQGCEEDSNPLMCWIYWSFYHIWQYFWIDG